MEKIIIVLIVVLLCVLLCKILSALLSELSIVEVRLPLTESNIREIMKPVCLTNATYRKVSDKELDETCVQKLKPYVIKSSDFYSKRNARRLCAGVDLGHPVFSPEQAMVAFKKLFGSLVSFTAPIPIREWMFKEYVILRQYLAVKYGYVVEVCGFYAVIFIGDRYCYICEKFSCGYDSATSNQVNSGELKIFLRRAKTREIPFGVIQVSAYLIISLKDYTVKEIRIGTGAYERNLLLSKTYENHPSQEEYEADIRKYCKKVPEILAKEEEKKVRETVFNLLSVRRITPTMYKQKPDIIIRTDIDDVR